MGYTQEGKKIVIWTQKIFVADDYPFNDEGENNTLFFENLHARTSFMGCKASLPEEEKIKLVSGLLNIPTEKIVLRSKKSHHNKKRSV